MERKSKNRKTDTKRIKFARAGEPPMKGTAEHTGIASTERDWQMQTDDADLEVYAAKFPLGVINTTKRLGIFMWPSASKKVVISSVESPLGRAHGRGA